MKSDMSDFWLREVFDHCESDAGNLKAIRGKKCFFADPTLEPKKG